MNATKRINVNFSSLVGLKAELLRKQTEVNAAKLKAEAAQPIPKPRKKNKRPKREDDKEKISEEPDIDVGAHKKSKLMLEAKSRLYDRLKKSKNNNDNFLVDFKNKSDESEEEKEEEEEEIEQDLDLDDDDWVEYVDCFGRTRKCLREDLPVMQEKDKLVEEQVMKRRNDALREKDRVETPVVEEKEPEIEIMRRKWEEQTQKLADKANIHYQDILFDEARAHGVGYYAFSQDEEERIKQQENLAKLRMDTEKKQKEMKELKELKERMEQNRLKAARIRQRIRAGLPAEPTEEELAQESKTVQDLPSTKNLEETDKTDEVSTASQEQKEEQKEDSAKKEDNECQDLVSKEDKIRALGELLGKRPTWRKMSQEEWVEKYRNIRVDEFAPAYTAFRHGGYLVPENRSQKSSPDTSTEGVDYPAEPNEIPLPPCSSSTDEPVSNVKQDSSDGVSPIVERTSEDATNSIDTNTVPENVVKRNIDEESIMAGLKYLREKFEERQHT